MRCQGLLHQHAPTSYAKYNNQMENLQQKGMYEVFCLVVNDIHVTKVWAEQTKALETGLNL